MPGRRARLLASTIERLEMRGLLSVAASMQVAHVDLSEKVRSSADVAAVDSSHPGGRITSGESSLGETARTSHSNVAPSVERSNAGARGASKRSVVQVIAAGELVDAVQSTAHRPDPQSIGEPEVIGSDIIGLGSDTTYDPAVANSVVGWGPGAAASGPMSLTSAPDRGAGLDGRSKAVASSPVMDTPTPGLFADVTPGLRLRPGDARTWAGPPGDEAHAFTIVSATAVREPPSPAWAELLDGALKPDWESIDREMRRFLADIGGLADTPEGREAGEAWLLWIGAATSLFLAHRAWYGPRRFFRRAGSLAAGVPTRHPVPVGPWPLGLP
jgi:hypothetical protein